MSLPKFSNPHNATVSSAPCTRSQVFGDDEVRSSGSAFILADADHSDELFSSYQDELRWLERHLRSSLVYHDAPSGVSSSRRSSVDSRPQKRRKTNGDDGRETSVFVFRLLSGDTSPRKIDIKPKPPKAIQVVEREYEDSKERAELRMRQASDVAVDFAWVMQQSRISHPYSKSNSKKKCRILLASNGLSFKSLDTASKSNILITECPKAAAQLPPHLRTRDAKPKPSPHGLKDKLCCPLLPVSPHTGTSKERRGRRRLRSSPRRRSVPCL